MKDLPCFLPVDEIIDNNQMTLRMSNCSSFTWDPWDKTISQPQSKDGRNIHDSFHQQQSVFDNETTTSSLSMLGNQQQSRQCSYIEKASLMGSQPFCLDSAFDRIEKNLIKDLFDTEQRIGAHDENFASSTVASIASSVIDLDNYNESESHEDSSNDGLCDPEIVQIESMPSPLVKLEAALKTHFTDAEKNETSPNGGEEKCKSDSRVEYPSSDEKRLSTYPNHSQSVKAESPPLDPPVISLAELGEIRKRNQLEREDHSIDCNAKHFSSMPSSPKPPKRSWSREDLRIPRTIDSNHTSRRAPSAPRTVDPPFNMHPKAYDNPDFRRVPSASRTVDSQPLSYRNAALKGSRKTLSISSYDVESSNRHMRQTDSLKLARSVSSLKSFGKEIIIDGSSIHFNVCAQSDSALEDHEDSSHWNVIPRVGLVDETDDATTTKDGATTISSIPSSPEIDEIATLREERNAYRDMCLTLGSEIAKLKNLLSVEQSDRSFVYMSTPVASMNYFQKSQPYDPQFNPPPRFYKGVRGKFTVKSDIGIHNDNQTQMSEDETDVMHESVTATDTSLKHRTVNSSSFNNLRLASLKGGRTGSDVVSLEYDTAGFSVTNPPTSTCFFKREFGPEHLHGLQSRLGRDMNNFLSSIAIQLKKQDNRRELSRKRLTTLVTTLWPRAQVKIYGSFATNLCLPSSDLDFVICLPAVHKNTPADAPGDLEGRNAINESNQKLLARKLKSESWIEPRSIKIIERTAVPVISVATKDVKSQSIKLDISFDSPEHHGMTAIKLVTDVMDHYPLVRPLVLVLKQFLLDKGLLTAYTGGLSSYCVFLMATRYLQENPLGWADKGCLLMGFLDFYGNHFDPKSTGISVERHEYFPRPHYAQQGTNPDIMLNRRHSFNDDNHFDSLSQHQYYKQRSSSSRQKSFNPNTFDPIFIEDPTSTDNNVGRNSFRINQVQRAFSDAHRALVASLEWDMNSSADLHDCGSYPLLKSLIQREDTYITHF